MPLKSFSGKKIRHDIKWLPGELPFHKPSTLSKFAKKIGCTVKFLPPYSPDFNKIENHWYSVKTKLRKILRDQVGIDMNSAINEIFMCAE